MATLFNDNFNRTDSTTVGANYTEAFGAWSIVSNQLKIVTHTGGSGILAFWDYISYDAALGANPAADYEVEIIFNAPSSAEPMIGARFVDVNNFYGFQARTDADNIELFKVVSGSQISLGTFAVTINTSTNYTLKISCIGSAIKGYLNGVERISATDSDITATGKPIIASDIANIVFDDFFVYGTSASTPQAKGVFMTPNTGFWGA